MKKITTLYVREREFYIVQNADGFYLAIEDKYVDGFGCLKQALNGLQMHASKKLENCIETTKLVVEVDYLVSKGMERNEAMRIALGR